ncbi:MAG TPA: tetratricopeptide repeat protein [Candidatus Polarisedimenticolia bacterium]|nr:tetratricopeptide repeat protein [Candidatus Polarisedimenticolia bacterium]
MNRDQLRFLASGILFGFLVGYIIAYAVHEPRVKQTAAPVPAAGNLGMGSVVGAQPPQAGAAAPPGGSGQGEAMMDRMMEEIAALKAALEQDPADLPALVRLANLNHDSGQFAEAVELYARALQVRPEDVNVRTDMAICLRELGRVEDAIAEFRVSLTHDPQHWQTWLNLGIVSLFDRQDVETAAEAFAQVEKLNPGYQDLPRLKEAARQAATSPSSGS